MTLEYTQPSPAALERMRTGLQSAAVQAVLDEVAALEIPPPVDNVDGDVEDIGEIPVTHRFVEAPGDYETVRWHFVEAGDGPPLVLLHGIPQSWFMWRALLAALAAHFRVIALDLKGYGQSAKGRGDYRHEGVAGQVIALLDRLGIERFCLMSHDRGTVQADHIAARLPDRVVRWVRGSQHLWRYHPDLSPQEHLFSDPETRAILGDARAIVTRFFGLLCKHPIAAADVVRTIQEFSRPGTGVAVERYFQSSTFRQEWLDRRNRLIAAWRCPMLLLQGADEPPMPREMYDGVAERLHDARLAFIDAGHFFVEENPAETLAAVLPFLTGVHN